MSIQLFVFTFNDIGILFTIVGAIASIIALFLQNLSLKKKEKVLNKFNPFLEVLADYREVWSKAESVFEEELSIGGGIKIKNIGLDLEKILPDLKDFIEKKIRNKNNVKISYSGLIVNPESSFIKPLINGVSNVKTEYVNSAFVKIAEYKERYNHDANIFLEIKKYDLPPVIHGMLINNRHLFLGFTEVSEGKLFGSGAPYLYMKYNQNIAATSHYFSVFSKWFKYYWGD